MEYNKANDSFLVTELLGYLMPEQWKDCVKRYPQHEQRLREFMQEQEEVFCFSLIPEVIPTTYE